MSTLVLGATGQVGRHLQRLLTDAVCWNRDHADLERPWEAHAAILGAKPKLIINAAAYTAVDRAESEPDKAWRVNAEGVAALALAARELNVPLLHLSTDYVFDGSSPRPYSQTDVANPINVYGRTKLAGELAVVSVCPQHWILRSSWLFSEFGSNFVKTILRLAEERNELRIVDDQTGIPTYAGDLAHVICDLVQQFPENPPNWGTYHVTGGPQSTWCGFAREVVNLGYQKGLISKRPEIMPISTSDYPTPAIRPRNSRLEGSRELKQVLSFWPDWREGLIETVEAIKRLSR